VTLYTPDYAAATPVHTSGVEVVVRVLEAPLATLAGQNALIELQSIANSDGGTPVPPGGAVLAGRGGGAAALTGLWERSRNTLFGTPALFRLQTSTLNAESIGGSPILLREGAIAVSSDGSDLVDGLHPRTVVGWNLSVTFFVVIDGRQPGYSVGADLPEAAMLLFGLGATDAINLDGGGSATLTIAGEVVNRPSDRLVVRDGKQIVVAQPAPGDVVVGNVERRVADALAIVSPTPASIAEDLGVELVSPPPGTAIDPSADPASRPPAAMMGPADSRPDGSPVP
jgi:hypothetical protein